MRRSFESGSRKPKPHQTSLKIGDVARTSGVAIDTLRFYERQGLLGRPERTESGYRLYAPTVLDQLEFIRRARALGFSLAEIARIMSERRAGQIPCQEVREVVRRRLVALDEELANLERYRRELARALEEWDGTGDVPGHVCGLIEATEIREPPPRRRSIARRP